MSHGLGHLLVILLVGLGCQLCWTFIVLLAIFSIALSENRTSFLLFMYKLCFLGFKICFPSPMVEEEIHHGGLLARVSAVVYEPFRPLIIRGMFLLAMLMADKLVASIHSIWIYRYLLPGFIRNDLRAFTSSSIRFFIHFQIWSTAVVLHLWIVI